MVYLLACGEYEQYGVVGLYDSLDAAQSVWPEVAWTPDPDGQRCWWGDGSGLPVITAHDVQGKPPREVNAVDLTRSELGLTRC